MSLKKAFLSLGVLSALVLSSCTIGLGEEVDLEAPVITITSPENLAKVGLNFELRGTCTDNIKVKKVEVRNLNLGDNGLLGEATIEGEEWYFPISLTHEQEGEISFSCSAIDEAGNTSTKSIKTKVLLVDQTSPEDLSWYIDRGNGIQTPLYTLEKLKSIYEFENALNTDNKDIAQNQVFNIYSRFYDAMSINEITLNLEKEDGTVLISKTVSSDETNINYIGDSSIFTPKFTFTEEELVQKDPSFISGKHYLRLSYSCKDDHGNANSKALDWMIWYPESDYPGISQSFIENNSILINVGTAIPINFFDDDGIQEYKCALLRKETVETLFPEFSTDEIKTNLNNDSSIRDNLFSVTIKENVEIIKNDKAINGTRDSFATITTPSTPNEMYLICCTQDINGTWSTSVIPTIVTDAKVPLLYVNEPTENTIPVLNVEGVFKIKGYTLDSNGCKTVKIVYLPEDSNSSIAEKTAIEIINNDKTTGNVSKLDYPNGIKLWSYVLGESVEDENTGWKRQDYEFEFNLFDTEIFDENKRKANKFFEIVAIDNEGNKTFKQFKLSGDNVIPTMEILTSQGIFNDMQVWDYTADDLIIKFKAEKATGAKINKDAYYLIFAGEKLNLSDDGEYKTVTIEKSKLKTLNDKNNTRPSIIFYAEDELGNSVKDKRTLVLSSLPTLTSIESDLNDGVTLSVGQKIRLRAKFSKPVKINNTNGTPKIKLINIENTINNNKNFYAEWNPEINETDSLYFEYIIEEGDILSNTKNSVQIGKSKNSEEESYIYLNGGTLLACGEGIGSVYITNECELTKKIKVDGIKPSIETISLKGPVISGTRTKTAVKKNDLLIATVEMSEPVNIINDPKLILFIENSEIIFDFQSISNKTITFEYTVENQNGDLKKNFGKAFSSVDVNNITDLNGNTLKLGQNENKSTGIVFDNISPNPPTINLESGKYNEYKTLVLSGIEENAVAEYSLDSGVSWKEYTSGTELVNGDYEITTRQTDLAGNISKNLPNVSININANFPNVTGVSIRKADGSYKKDTEIEVRINFDGKVIAKNKEDIYLTFNNSNENKTERKIYVIPTTNTGANILSFIYTVAEDDDYNGMKITAIKYSENFTDENGNKPTGTLSDDLPNRDKIILDGIAPNISTYYPENGKIFNDKVNNQPKTFEIKLTFNENIYKETGTIILQRKGKWAIPAVFTDTDFQKYYEIMTSDNQQKIMKTDSSGTEIFHAQTGIAVGPYRKITHGLKLSNDGTKYIPDDSTKYVLAYELGLYDDREDSTAELSDGTLKKDNKGKVLQNQLNTFNASVSDIRSALESVDYHQHKVDVASDNIKIEGNIVTIQFNEEIEDGREWELIIPKTAFRDNAENFYRGMNLNKYSGTSTKTVTEIQQNPEYESTATTLSDQYSVWSDKVAQPVVRVDRYTHGWGAREPKADGSLINIEFNNGKFKANISVDNSAVEIAPTGYVRYRIDCETPDVNILYKEISGGTVNYNNKTSSTGITYKTDVSAQHYNHRNIIDDIAKTTLEQKGTTSYTTTHLLSGNGNYTQAKKSYITAYATKDNFISSENGYEGIFQTIVYVYGVNNQDYLINIEGGTATGGQPKVSGFPLRDATDENDPTNLGRYSKNTYCINGDTNNQIFVSYEIISDDWAVLPCRNNHSKDYPKNSYGGSAYITAQNYW